MVRNADMPTEKMNWPKNPMFLSILKLESVNFSTKRGIVLMELGAILFMWIKLKMTYKKNQNWLESPAWKRESFCRTKNLDLDLLESKINSKKLISEHYFWAINKLLKKKNLSVFYNNYSYPNYKRNNRLKKKWKKFPNNNKHITSTNYNIYNT